MWQLCANHQVELVIGRLSGRNQTSREAASVEPSHFDPGRLVPAVNTSVTLKQQPEQYLLLLVAAQ